MSISLGSIFSADHTNPTTNDNQRSPTKHDRICLKTSESYQGSRNLSDQHHKEKISTEAGHTLGVTFSSVASPYLQQLPHAQGTLRWRVLRKCSTLQLGPWKRLITVGMRTNRKETNSQFRIDSSENKTKSERRNVQFIYLVKVSCPEYIENAAHISKKKIDDPTGE